MKRQMKNTAIILLLSAAIAVVGCGQRTKQSKENSVREQEQTIQRAEFDEAGIPQFPENSDIRTDVEIVLPAGYRGTEPADFELMLSEEWYDFYQDSITKQYFLERADLEIGKYYDGCLDDSTTYIGSRRNSLILIKGITPQNGVIPSFAPKKHRVWPEETYSFPFNGETYIFRGEGIMEHTEMIHTDEGIEKWGEALNYKLYLSDAGNEQLIVAITSFNDTFVEILWIGDLDADGKPDFILDTSRDYEEKTVLLFLSSKAGEGEIVKAAAYSSYLFDC